MMLSANGEHHVKKPHSSHAVGQRGSGYIFLVIYQDINYFAIVRRPFLNLVPIVL